MTINRIAFVFGLILVLTVSISAMLTNPVSKSNTNLITAVYRGISQKVYKGSTSYDLYLEGNPAYRIGDANSECFAYTTFKNKVIQGQSISVYVNSNTLISKPFIVSIVADGQEYLSFDCINQHLANNKIKLPLLSAGAFILAILAIRFRDKKNQKRNANG